MVENNEARRLFFPHASRAVAEGRPEGPGELAVEGSEEQQHAEYQPGPSTG